MATLNGSWILGPDGKRYRLVEDQPVTSALLNELVQLRGVDLGNKIKYLRESKGQSQRQLAQMARMTQVQLCRIEGGKVNKPHNSIITALSNALMLLADIES